MSGTVEDVIAYAESQIGSTDGGKYFNICDSVDLGDWCMAFAMASAKKGGVSVDWPPQGEEWKKFVVPDSYDCPKQAWRTPQQVIRGTFPVFDWDGDGRADHIGICTGVGNDGIWTIEGNTSGGKVDAKFRPWSVVLGGIQPNYATRPHWRHDKGGWWYDHGDGTYATGWEEITDKDGVKRWYCFDDDGWMLTGFVQHTDKDTGEKNWYYLSEWTEGYAAPEGHMVCGGIYTPKEGVNAGEPFAFYKDGRMVESGVVEAYPWQKHDNHFGRLMT